MKKIILNLIMILCIVSFAFFGYKIYNYKKEEKKQEEIRDNLIENAITISTQENNETENINPHMEINFDILKSKNKNIVAWIYSEGTPINYPIVQSKDNDYYLRRDYYQNKNSITSNSNKDEENKTKSTENN